MKSRTLASRMAPLGFHNLNPLPLPLLSLSLRLPGPQLKTHIFSVRGGLDQRGTKHIKSPRMDYVVVFEQVSQRCQILHGSLFSLNHLILQHSEYERLCLISYLNFSCLSAIIQHLMN